MQTSTTTCNAVGSSTECITIGGTGFTYGESLIILILLMFFTLFFFDRLKNWLFGQKIESPVKMKYEK